MKKTTQAVVNSYTISHSINAAGNLINVLSSGKEAFKTSVRAVVDSCIQSKVKYHEALQELKPFYLQHNTWPILNGEKVGENKARGTASGNAFNSLAVTLRQSFKADAKGYIVEKTKEEKKADKEVNRESTEVKAEEAFFKHAESRTSDELIACLVVKLGNRDEVLKAVEAFKLAEEIPFLKLVANSK